MPPSRSLPLVLLLVAAAAVLWFSRTLSIGYLSDDFGMAAFLHRDTGTVDWGRVFADFAEPWGAPTLYRPLVSVSFGVNLTFGTSPIGFHLLNVLLVAIAAAATGHLAARLCPQAPLRAALAAGLCVVLHPAMVEPASWIASRTSGLELCFSTLALAAFAAYLTGSSRRRWPHLLWFLLALFSKEGALTLPLALLCVDLLQQPSRPWRQRLRLHAPLLLVWAFHLACRTLVLGSYSAGADPTRVQERLVTMVQHAGELLTPPAPLLWWLAVPLLVLAVAAVAGSPLRLWWFLGWLLAGILPTSLLRDQGPAFHGRYVCAAVPALAVLLATGTTALRGRWRWLTAACLLAMLLGFGIGSQHWLDQYQRAGERVGRQQQALVEAAGAAAAPGRPLGILSLSDGGIPVSMLQQPLWPALAMRPFAAQDHATVALSGLLDPGVAARGMLGDPRPLRALLAAGATLVRWDDRTASLQRTAVAPGETVEFTGAAGRFAPTQPVPALAIEAIEVRLPARARDCRLRLLGDLADAFAFGERRLQAEAGSDRFVFDLTPAMAPVLWHGFGQPFPGCEVTVDGVAAGSGVRVRGLAAPSGLPLPRPLRGAVLPAGGVAGALASPDPGAALRLYLLLPTGPVGIDVPPGAAVAFDDEVRWRLEYAADVYGPCLVHLFWQGLGAGAGPRSALDWFTLR